MAKLSKDAQKIRRVLRKLVNRIEVVSGSPEYRNIYVQAMNHGYPYQGPTFKTELDAAKKLLEKI